jgi:hypothetical protein
VGSYYRTPRWRFYDQIMLSKGLLNIKKKPFFLSGTESIFSKKEIILNDGMTYTITNRNGKPISFDIKKNRGCSDHFPVYIGVEI